MTRFLTLTVQNPALTAISSMVRQCSWGYVVYFRATASPYYPLCRNHSREAFLSLPYVFPAVSSPLFSTFSCPWGFLSGATQTR